MPPLFTIIKFIVILQLFIIAGFVLLSYLSRYYLLAQQKRSAEHAQEVKAIICAHLSEQQLIPKEQYRYLQKHISHLLLLIKDLAKSWQKTPFWLTLLQQLSSEVFKPYARKKAFSRHWLSRYYAADCYNYGFDEADEDRLFHLINDSSLLVSLLAAMIALKTANPVLVNEMITTFASGRQLQQSFFAQLVNLDNQHIYGIITHRLSFEKDPYARLFCYRLLVKLPPATMLKEVHEDLQCPLVNLRVGVIHYLAHCQDHRRNEILYQQALDPAWEIRAAVANALATINNPKSISILALLITDPEWWVRINSANSLYKLGEKGIAILKEQTPSKDKFAFETAQKVLLAGRHS